MHPNLIRFYWNWFWQSFFVDDSSLESVKIFLYDVHVYNFCEIAKYSRIPRSTL